MRKNRNIEGIRLFNCSLEMKVDAWQRIIDIHHAFTILVLRLFTVLAAVVGLTRLTTQALVNSTRKPLGPLCDNWLTERFSRPWAAPSGLRPSGAALGRENRSVNQLSHSGSSGFRVLSTRARVVNPKISTDDRGLYFFTEGR